MEEASESGVKGHTQLHSKSEVSLEYRKHVSKKTMKKGMYLQGIIYILFYILGLWNPVWSHCCCCFVCFVETGSHCVVLAGEVTI